MHVCARRLDFVWPLDAKKNNFFFVCVSVSVSCIVQRTMSDPLKPFRSLKVPPFRAAQLCCYCGSRFQGMLTRIGPEECVRWSLRRCVVANMPLFALAPTMRRCGHHITPRGMLSPAPCYIGDRMVSSGSRGPKKAEAPAPQDCRNVQSMDDVAHLAGLLYEYSRRLDLDNPEETPSLLMLIWERVRADGAAVRALFQAGSATDIERLRVAWDDCGVFDRPAAEGVPDDCDDSDGEEVVDRPDGPDPDLPAHSHSGRKRRRASGARCGGTLAYTLIVLMHLRHGMRSRALSALSGVGSRRVRQVIQNVRAALYDCSWTREWLRVPRTLHELRSWTPSCFRHEMDTAGDVPLCVFDCTYVFCERSNDRGKVAFIFDERILNDGRNYSS